jgi:hypothetical protein
MATGFEIRNAGERLECLGSYHDAKSMDAPTARFCQKSQIPGGAFPKPVAIAVS